MSNRAPETDLARIQANGLLSYGIWVAPVGSIYVSSW
jgi:hypothetical protein